MSKPWMLYGCYGYSGELILKHAVSKGLSPILAGRSKGKTEALARAYGLDYRVFDLSDQAEVQRNIADCLMVFNAAGPYSSTCLPMVQACLETGTHNLSLVGEIPMLETLSKFDQQAKDKNIIIGVGLGYDVHPTDCIAMMLKERLPNATHLTLAMDGPTGMSPGSYKELVEQIAEEPFWLRRNGALIKGKPQSTKIDFGDGPKLSMSIAWGDTSTAFSSTQIPNIDIYSSISYADWLTLKTLGMLSPILKLKVVNRMIHRLIDMTVSGPSVEEREHERTRLIGKVTNDNGTEETLQIEIPSSYRITYLSSVYAIEKVLNEADALAPGYRTPGQLLGSESIYEVEDVHRLHGLG